jgi:hypothetical protein
MKNLKIDLKKIDSDKNYLKKFSQGSVGVNHVDEKQLKFIKSFVASGKPVNIIRK